MNRMQRFWHKHKKIAGLLAALIGTPIAGAVYVVTDHLLTHKVVVSE
ncbi:MAG: hypothetical protein ACK4GU_13435 [Alishewanella aestuarii]